MHGKVFMGIGACRFNFLIWLLVGDLVYRCILHRFRYLVAHTSPLVKYIKKIAERFPRMKSGERFVMVRCSHASACRINFNIIFETSHKSLIVWFRLRLQRIILKILRIVRIFHLGVIHKRCGHIFWPPSPFVDQFTR